MRETMQSFKFAIWSCSRLQLTAAHDCYDAAMRTFVRFEMVEKVEPDTAQMKRQYALPENGR